MNIGEFCPEQYIILNSQARAIWYTARDKQTIDGLRTKYLTYLPYQISAVDLWLPQGTHILSERKKSLSLILYPTWTKNFIFPHHNEQDIPFVCKYKMYTNIIKHDLFNINLVIIITHWPLYRYVGLWMISRLI